MISDVSPLRFVALHGDSLEVVATFALTPPYDIVIDPKQTAITLRIDSLDMGRGTITTKAMETSSETPLTQLHLHFHIRKVKRDLLWLLHRPSVSLVIEGHLQASAQGRSFSLPFSATQSAQPRTSLIPALLGI